MTETLKIALIHFNVRYKDVPGNVERLLALNREAARGGNRIIVNTEMGLSGYSFASAEDIRPHALTLFSEPIRALSDMAREFKAYICLGLALEDPDTGILTNAALVLGPDGAPLLTYHKINAEARWACPGNPCQDNVFSTPWGKVGVVICADSYHGLLMRQTALKGADLILVCANWPQVGLDPREIWSMRARENGIYIAACNRTGVDLTMECHTAPSGLFSPDGTPVICRTHPDSTILDAEIPLHNGRIVSGRKEILARRTPSHYTPIYPDTRYATNDAQVLTDWHGLNPPGPVTVTAFTASPGSTGGKLTCEAVQHVLDRQIHSPGNADDPESALMVFPVIEGERVEIDRLLEWLEQELPNTGPALCLSRMTASGLQEIIFAGPGQYPRQHQRQQLIRHRRDTEGYGPGPKGLTIIDSGPLRLGLCLPEALLHPETGIAHAKLGCDLLVSAVDTVDPLDRLVMAGRCTDTLAVAVAGTDTAFICAPPKNHARFAEALVYRTSPSPEIDPEMAPKIDPTTASGSGKKPDRGTRRAKMILNTGDIRKRIHQNRIDYHTLLAGTRSAGAL